jgi:hypothetical protein
MKENHNDNLENLKRKQTKMLLVDFKEKEIRNDNNYNKINK